jgi:hypothetical protein
VGRGNLVRRTQELKKLGAKTKKSLPDDLDNEADGNVLEDNQSN